MFLPWRLCYARVACVALLVLTFAVPMSVRAQVAGADPQLSAVQLLDANGSPLVNAGIEVQVIPVGGVSAWGPNPWPSAGRGTTDSSGHLLAVIQPPTGAGLRGADGVVNYEVYTQGSNYPIPVLGFSRYYGTDPSRQREFAQLALPATVQLTSGQSAHFHATLTRQRQVQATHRLLHLQANLRPQLDCMQQGTWHVVANATGNTTVGDLHSETWLSKAQFHYGATADSNIGIGYSSDGGSTWSLSGSLNVSQSASSETSIGKGYTNYGHALTLPFYYEKDRYYDCYGLATSEYQILADYWEGGSPATSTDTSGNDDLYNQYYSTPLYAGGGFNTGSETSYTYSAGVGIWGATLSAESGYGTYVRLDYTAAQDGCIYGLHQFPTNAQIVQAGTKGWSCFY